MIEKIISKKNISILTLLVIICFSTSGWTQDEMTGKLMMGYQGWFLAENDGSGPNEWRHWFRSTNTPSAENFTIDMWPDMSEYTSKYNTNMAYADGSNAQLFSSHDLSTTRKHFEWMQDYNIHGVHLQRFLGELGDNRFFQARNNVLQNVMTSAAEYDRHFSVMYDISGVPDDGNLYNKLITDWEYLVDSYDILNAVGYVKEDSRPVVAIWGIGFKDRGLKASTFYNIINYFHNTAAPKYRAYVMGGVPDGWRSLSGASETGSEWYDIYNSLDMISPWSVGRYKDEDEANNWKNDFVIPDIEACNIYDIDYMPVIWPGFSWANLKNVPLNEIPRNGGEFYWRQAYNAIGAGAKYIYVAMFDEVDEATAMFKLTETKNKLPFQGQGILVPLDVDGTTLPSDWYLQLADQTQQMLDGTIPLSSAIPISPVTAAGNGSEMVSQQNVPSEMGLAEKLTVKITMKNTGTSTWTKATGYKLGSQNTQDNVTWGFNRVELLDGDQISPGQEKIFEFEITAPNDASYYDFQWKMVQEDVEWFGVQSSNQLIEVGGAGDFLDDCDSKLDWNPSKVTINSIEKKQGAAALQFIGSDTDEFKKTFSTTYNAFGTESGTVLKFWYYVSDVSLLTGNNQVEIGSAGKPDTNEYSWSLNGLKSGWNFVQLNTSDAGKIGTPDLSAINWFRLYRFKSGTVTTRIDAIQLIGEFGLSVDNYTSETSFNLFPNPADTQFSLEFRLIKSSSVSITLINIMGQVVSHPIYNQQLNPGNHRIEIPVKTLKAGIYFANIKIDDKVFTKKVLIK